jgi:uncharacterized membrane-anchored protein YjiN (DUF445 family)
MESSTKNRLRKKLKNKNPKKPDVDEDNLFNMLNQVNKMLKQNPNMVKKVSKCINNIFENKELMSSLVSEIETNVKDDIQDSDSQTLDSKLDGIVVEASTKDSVQ